LHVKNGESGFLVPYADEKKLVSRILLLLDNKELYMRMSIKAKKYAKYFDYHNIINRLIFIYNSLYN